MATRRRKSTRSATTRRRSAGTGRKTYRRRRSTLNASTVKPMKGLGLIAGVGTVVAPVAINALMQKSTAPLKGLANVNTAMEIAKRGALGYLGGYAAGMIVDKTPLKKPVNKVLKKVGMR